MDVALKDTHFKGSLLDRVVALEHTLFQVQIFLFYLLFFMICSLFHYFCYNLELDDSLKLL